MNTDEKIDKILDTQIKQAITLERLTVTVEDHVRRTNLLETKQDKQAKETQRELEPIKKHVNMVNGAFKFIVLLGILFGMAEVWLKFSGH